MTSGYNHFGKVAKALHPASVQIVKKTAFDAEANIKANIRQNGQVDSGFMLNSVYTVTSDGSTYQGRADALPEVPPVPNDLTAYVAVAARYAVYQNYGTRFLPPRPFFEPGIYKAGYGLENAMRALAAKIEEAAR